MANKKELTSEEMKDWAYKNSAYVKLEDGESFVGTLLGAKPITSRFDSEKEIMQYRFELEDGVEKMWENGSTRVCEELSALIGDVVKITRRGEGNQTKYEISSPSEHITP